jgi:hypothetical protein
MWRKEKYNPLPCRESNHRNLAIQPIGQSNGIGAYSGHGIVYSHSWAKQVFRAFVLHFKEMHDLLITVSSCFSLFTDSAFGVAVPFRYEKIAIITLHF